MQHVQMQERRNTDLRTMTLVSLLVVTWNTSQSKILYLNLFSLTLEIKLIIKSHQNSASHVTPSRLSLTFAYLYLATTDVQESWSRQAITLFLASLQHPQLLTDCDECYYPN